FNGAVARTRRRPASPLLTSSGSHPLQWSRRANATETPHVARPGGQPVASASMEPSRERDGDAAREALNSLAFGASMEPSRERDGDALTKDSRLPAIW